ncbi:MAG: MBL fold metallo-hydrolase [Synergistaceae bacterium]|jgi:glyoxylase-like metal-dependent hydrolase (beta-lactamase superfamily II)|nr:MBL fold metallo-hydrolase [Synergistaceae bacterium]
MHICFGLASIFLLGAPLLFAAEAGAEAVMTKKFSVGEAEVWAIADSLRDIDMDVFPTADPEAVKRYVPTGKAPSSIMVYLVKTGGETVLVDAGLGAPSGDRASHLLPLLKEIGVSPEDVTLVLITHMHGDHIGGLVKNGQKEKVFLALAPSTKVLVSRVERDFWLGDNISLYPDRKATFDMARRVWDLYEGATGTFEFGDEVAPGITAVDASGHTPGHAAFLLESGGERMLFAGDFLHAAALQLPRPDINSSYDMEPEKAAATRERLLKRSAEEKLPLAGSHTPFPGVITVSDGLPTSKN